MSEKESKKTETEIEQLKDEELDAVSGGILDSFFDKCSAENPERKYVPALCGWCPNLDKQHSNSSGKTMLYCGKALKVIYEY